MSDELRRGLSRWSTIWFDNKNWFARVDDPANTERLDLIGPHLRKGTFIFEFECSKKLYKSAQDPEVQGMIKEVMDAAYAKFPDLRNYPVKIEAHRKGESILDDTSDDEGLDMPPSGDDDE